MSKFKGSFIARLASVATIATFSALVVGCAEDNKDEDKKVSSDPVSPTIKTYTLTINNTASGTTNPTAGTYTHNENTEITVTAIPTNGYKFDGWTAVPAMPDGVNPLNTTITFNIKGDLTLTANMTIEESPPDDVDINDFETIYFDYDKTDLNDASIISLGKAADAMREHPNIRVMAEGHADERGTSSYNVGLGEARAQVVRDYLISYGIASGRIEITSFGKERPANPNCGDNYVNEECHSKNRRVDALV